MENIQEKKCPIHHTKLFVQTELDKSKVIKGRYYVWVKVGYCTKCEYKEQINEENTD